MIPLRALLATNSAFKNLVGIFVSLVHAENKLVHWIIVTLNLERKQGCEKQQARLTGVISWPRTARGCGWELHVRLDPRPSGGLRAGADGRARLGTATGKTATGSTWPIDSVVSLAWKLSPGIRLAFESPESDYSTNTSNWATPATQPALLHRWADLVRRVSSRSHAPLFLHFNILFKYAQRYQSEGCLGCWWGQRNDENTSFNVEAFSLSAESLNAGARPLPSSGPLYSLCRRLSKGSWGNASKLHEVFCYND